MFKELDMSSALTAHNLFTAPQRFLDTFSRELVENRLRCVGIIADDCWSKYEHTFDHPLKTSQVFSEFKNMEYVTIAGTGLFSDDAVETLIRFTIGNYWVFFDPIDCQRVLTWNTKSMQVWVAGR